MRTVLGRLLELLGEARLATGPRGFEEAGWGPTPAEAREAFAYWSARARRLPWYRLRARREARELAARWHHRLRQARATRYGRGPLGTLAALAVDGKMPCSPRSPLRHWRLAATTAGAVVIVTVVVVVAVAASVAAHVLGALL